MSASSTNLPQKPKIINTSPVIHRDAKTFVVYTSPSELNEKLMRFHNTIITNLRTYDEYNKMLEKPIYLMLKDRDEIENLKNIKSPEKYFQNVGIFVLTNGTIEYLHNLFPNFREFAVNIIVLDNIHQHFTYLRPWNGTLVDGASILSIIYGSQIIMMNNLNPESTKEAIRHPCQRFKPITPSPEFWMFVQFYKPKEKAREQEINETLRLNADCEFIDKIVVFLEKEEHREDIKKILSKKPRSALAKIRFVSLLHRLTYSDFFQYVNSAEVPENTYVALTNADIYFDESIGNIWSISMENRMLALLRYEHSDDGTANAKMFGPRPDSQDTWIFSAESIKQRNWTAEQLEKFNYQLGIPGCDNSFTTDMIREKFLTVNPAGTIRTYHYHSSQIRNYTHKDILWRPAYVYITPTAIVELEQNNTFGDKFTTLPISNQIHIRSNTDARAQTYCTMMARHQKYVWNIGNNSVNTHLRVFELSKVISCSHGILFDTFKLYAGDRDDMLVLKYLKSANMNQLNKTVTIENFISIPIKTRNIYDNFECFILEYVIPLLFILKTVPKDNVYSFFWPEKMNPLLKFIDFPVKAKIIPVAYDINFYSEKCWAIMPGAFRINREAIQHFLASWKLKSVVEKSNILTLIDDGKLFSVKNESFIKDLENMVSKYGWELNIMSDGGGNVINQSGKLAQSGGIIFWNDVNQMGQGTGSLESTSRAWKLAWNLPPGSAYLEFQNEFKLSGESQELAAACSLDARIYILQKADDSFLHGLVVKYVEEYLAVNPRTESTVVNDQEKQGDDSSPVEEVSLSLNV
jgi:hypothetical protein